MAALFSVTVLIFSFIWIAAFIFGIIFWVKMIIDAAKRQFPKENDKVVWILVIVLASFIGALIYYFVVKKKAQN